MTTDDDGDDDVELIGVFETDEDRRKLVHDSTSKDDRNSMRDFMEEFYRTLPAKGQ